MSARNLERDPNRFELDLHCPECGHLVRATPVAGPVCLIAEYSDTNAYLICRCPRRTCDPMFVVYDRLNGYVTRVYPYPNTRADGFHKAIPAAIREDWAEAHRCFNGEGYRGTVAMCRRAMQSIAQDKGASGDKLHQQIDDLFAKQLITKSLHDVAHEIRHFGNFGAHPRDDGLDNIGRDDALAVMRLTGQFLTDLYIRPYETAELTKKRQKPETPQ
jgi:hypothetical protein